MKFTLSWLKEHLETEASLAQICAKLTAIGLEVEGVDDRVAWEPFTIAKVCEAKKHPDADKLQVLSVDVGKADLVQVVCGAKNARAGLVGVFAPAGTYIPGINTVLGVGKIRGIESFGMLCSERELELSDEHEGIISLAEDAPVGTSFAAYAGLDDPIIEIGLTPNRSDCASVHGIARDLAAAGLGLLKKQKAVEDIPTTVGKKTVRFDFSGHPLCQGFLWREIEGVQNGASPLWLQRRLRAIGLRPVNVLVDISNYLTFDLGQPLHIFDRDKIVGDLVVRRAKQGESFTALNGRDYTLSVQNCVIADESGVISLAGIMGGEATGCDMATRNIGIEVARFDAQNIATTGRQLGLISDARYRFERGVDPLLPEKVLARASALISQLCQGRACALQKVGWYEDHPKEIMFSFAQVKRLTNLELEAETIKAILRNLGFEVFAASQEDSEQEPMVRVKVPSWRLDIGDSADLVEEVIRIHGLDKIKPIAFTDKQAVSAPILDLSRLRAHLVRRTLAGRGMLEAVTYSFISKAHAQIFGGGSEGLQLVNPIASDMSDMRPSLLPGLLTAARRNHDRGFADVALFEIGATYHNDELGGQVRSAGGVRCNSARFDLVGRFWSTPVRMVDVFDAKADALAALAACGVDCGRLQVVRGAPSWYHPGRSGVLQLGPKLVLGYFGEFHPAMMEQFGLKGAICGFEVLLDHIPEPKRRAGKARPALQLLPLQMIKRDFAFVVDQDVAAMTLVRAATAADKKLIQAVQVFDVFADSSLGEGKKSVAIEVWIQPYERSLTEGDLESLAEKIIAAVVKQSGASLR
ncbi:phenylalanine--tRNA ligase subunit beta [Bartonella sp. DGB2]|uniref:phenylalanine--tRNA ligase subunit beta n=1 Tax=Bartonella sp. DGB2 TaxID=3388426 RepID=UPI00398FA367